MQQQRQAASVGSDRSGGRGGAKPLVGSSSDQVVVASPATGEATGDTDGGIGGGGNIGGGGHSEEKEGGESGEETTSIDGEEDFVPLPTEFVQQHESGGGGGGGGSADVEVRYTFRGRSWWMQTKTALAPPSSPWLCCPPGYQRRSQSFSRSFTALGQDYSAIQQ